MEKELVQIDQQYWTIADDEIVQARIIKKNKDTVRAEYLWLDIAPVEISVRYSMLWNTAQEAEVGLLKLIKKQRQKIAREINSVEDLVKRMYWAMHDDGYGDEHELYVLRQKIKELLGIEIEDTNF